jgi:hypothetical protein
MNDAPVAGVLSTPTDGYENIDLSTAILMKNAPSEEFLETCILYSFSTGCYGLIVGTRRGASIVATFPLTL